MASLHAIDATPHRSLRAQEGKEHRIAGVTTVGELRDEAAKARGLATCRLVYKGDLTKDPRKTGSDETPAGREMSSDAS